MLILVINPGSTSTKLAVYEDESAVFQKNISHSFEELVGYEDVMDQKEFRKQCVLNELKNENIPLRFDAIIGRGGLAKPVESGVYEVNERMVHDTIHARHRHACDLGCIISYELANMIPGCRCYIADPGCVDEMYDIAHVSGSPLISRICIWHALNQRAIAKKYAKQIGKEYEDLNLIICHLGGGISIAAHKSGRAVDANNALGGEGPFSPERAGSLPSSDLIRLCFSGKYTEKELLEKILRTSGLMGYLGTNDMREIEYRIEKGDVHAKLIVDAMLFQVAKVIASEGAVLYGKVDAVLLTGGLIYSKYIVDNLIPRIKYLAPVYCYAGEEEMNALALNALEALNGLTLVKIYK